MAKTKRIGELLVEHGAITKEQLKEGLKLQQERGGKICEILINVGHLTEEDLLRTIGDAGGMVSVALQHYTIDADLIQYIPKAFAVRHELMPLDKLGNNLTVAMAVPLDVQTREALEQMTGLRIRAILCSRSDVRAAITQYYGDLVTDDTTAGGGTQVAHSTTVDADTVRVESPPPDAVRPGPEAVRLKSVLSILEKLDEFPLLPEVHRRVMQRFDDPEVSVTQLTELIEQDPTLSANVLKLANSAAFAARSTFDSVQRAIAYIGLRELRNIVVGSAVMEALSVEADFDLNRMFLQSFHCGLLTRIIVDAAEVGDREVAFTAGLLHNIGEIVIRIFSQERYQQIEQLVRDEHRQRVEVEEELLGVAASEIGYHLAERWNIPESLANTIRFHNRLEKVDEAFPMGAAVALALRCMENDDVDLSFGDPARDSRLGELLQKLDLEGAALSGLEAKYRQAMEHLTRLDPSIA